MPAWENFRVVCSHWSAVFLKLHLMVVPCDGVLDSFFLHAAVFIAGNEKNGTNLPGTPTRGQMQTRGCGTWSWGSLERGSGRVRPAVVQMSKQSRANFPPPSHRPGIHRPVVCPPHPCCTNGLCPEFALPRCPAACSFAWRLAPPQRRPGFDVNNSGSFSAPSVAKEDPPPPRFHPLSPFLDCTAGPWPV